MATVKYIPGEEVIFQIRQSIFILIGQEIPLLVGSAAFIFILNFMAAPFWVYIILILLLLLIGSVIFLSWHNNVYILTNKRVENKTGIIGTREEEVALNDIQSVDVTRTPIGSIFNFGTVMIKASGEKREVDFTNVANARIIARQISDLSIDN